MAITAAESIKLQTPRKAKKPKVIPYAQREVFYQHCYQTLLTQADIKTSVKKFIIMKRKERGNSRSMAAFEQINYNINRGKQIKIALKGYVPEEELFLLSIADDTGKLCKGFRLLLDHIKEQQNANKGSGFAKINMLFSLGITFFVLRMSASAQENFLGNLDAHVKVPFSISTIQFVGDYFWWLMAALVIGVIGSSFLLQWAKPNWSSPTRKLLDGFGPFKAYSADKAADFLLVYGTFIEGGTNEKNALMAIEKSASPWMRERVSAIRRTLVSGNLIGDAIIGAGYDFPSTNLAIQINAMSQNTSFSADLMDLAAREKQAVIDKAAKRNQIQTALISAIVMAVLLFTFYASQQISPLIGRGSYF